MMGFSRDEDDDDGTTSPTSSAMPNEDSRDKKRMYMRRKAQMYRARDKAAATELREEAHALECHLQSLRQKGSSTRAAIGAVPWGEVARTRLHAKHEAVAANENLRRQLQDCAGVIQDLMARVDKRDLHMFQSPDTMKKDGCHRGMAGEERRPSPPRPAYVVKTEERSPGRVHQLQQHRQQHHQQHQQHHHHQHQQHHQHHQHHQHMRASQRLHLPPLRQALSGNLPRPPQAPSTQLRSPMHCLPLRPPPPYSAPPPNGSGPRETQQPSFAHDGRPVPSRPPLHELGITRKHFI
ncbi:Aste57867_14229 [Aphanomyces stellatus]|uniref:Aste57867_14229 protein n=1 Tax=Aphanomyces stellatus TaxID=120398 RepID=A0A485L040_9STRA|nr:hypothetical protein As57867_014178 [Aphanomyces stellatus]VFT91054.1 Aste57867_14229 [Aphanomyces stellatus]